MSERIEVLEELKDHLIVDRKKVFEIYPDKSNFSNFRYFGYIRAIMLIDELTVEIKNE